MFKEGEPTPLSLVETLASRFKKSEKISVLKRGDFFSFHDPKGVEIKDLLDPNHMPQITRYTNILVSEAFSLICGESPKGDSPVREIGGEGGSLHTISHIARQPAAYDIERGWLLRCQYKQAMVDAAFRIYRTEGVGNRDAIIPVKRCGSNIANGLYLYGPSRQDSEAKRLRWKGLPDMLGAGVVFNLDYLGRLAGKQARLLEGVRAAATTECVYIKAILDWGVPIANLQCDAVISCPAGARLADDFRRRLGFGQEGVTVYKGGKLNNDWYVVYDNDDPLLRYHEDRSLVGCQVLGDGGDLTSNIND